MVEVPATVTDLSDGWIIAVYDATAFLRYAAFGFSVVLSECGSGIWRYLLILPSVVVCRNFCLYAPGGAL